MAKCPMMSRNKNNVPVINESIHFPGCFVIPTAAINHIATNTVQTIQHPMMLKIFWYTRDSHD